MTLTLRNPAWLIMGLMQPFLYLLLFGPLLNSIATMPGFPPGGAFNVFVPGLLVMTALFSSAFVGFGLHADELREGVIERMRVTPMSRMATLLGRLPARRPPAPRPVGIVLVVLADPVRPPRSTGLGISRRVRAAGAGRAGDVGHCRTRWR